MTQPALLPPASDADSAISISGGSFAWEASSANVLRNINLHIPRGQLVMVVGEVGSGKTSLLAALLHELRPRGGSVSVSGTVGYTSQDPWICNATLRDNILMGLPFDEARYEEVVASCALSPDLAMLPAGDQSEIGEKGINLSGGQRHRVALARACYAGADVYLLDDPLSAVDAHVGRHLFDSCVCGLLRACTRVLVTHQIQYLSSADHVVVVNDGVFTHQGNYSELEAQGIDFHQFELQQAADEECEDEEGPASDDVIPGVVTTAIATCDAAVVAAEAVAIAGADAVELSGGAPAVLEIEGPPMTLLDEGVGLEDPLAEGVTSLHSHPPGDNSSGFETPSARLQGSALHASDFAYSDVSLRPDLHHAIPHANGGLNQNRDFLTKGASPPNGHVETRRPSRRN